MAYLSDLFGGGAQGGMGLGGGASTPSAFTSPGMSPAILASLLAMQNRSPGSAAVPGSQMPVQPPMFPNVQNNSQNMGPGAPQMPSAGAVQGQNNLQAILPLLQKLGGLGGLFGGAGVGSLGQSVAGGLSGGIANGLGSGLGSGILGGLGSLFGG